MPVLPRTDEREARRSSLGRELFAASSPLHGHHLLLSRRVQKAGARSVKQRSRKDFEYLCERLERTDFFESEEQALP
jgi:hypothetical protein